VADASGLRRLVEVYGGVIHDKGAASVVARVSAATPKVTGRLEQARRRTDTMSGTVFSAEVEQPGGQGEPDQLPNWLDGNVEFEIVPVRARFLVFPKIAGLGSASFPRGFVFAKRVVWRPRPGSVGFWSKNVNAAEWLQALERA
jgi:hypothetical protein